MTLHQIKQQARKSFETQFKGMLNLVESQTSESARPDVNNFLDSAFWIAYYRAKSPESAESTIRMAAEQANLDLVRHLHTGKDDESYFADL